MRNKKGQITIFIIVGIIILAGVGLYTAIRTETIKGKLAPEIELSIEEVPIEFRPVRSFIENCLTEISKEGLTKLGERGGFIKEQYLLEPDAVPFSPGSDYSIAYWWHLSSPNNCAGNCQFTSIPEDKLFLKKGNNRVSIESQLEDYIKENLGFCLNNFETLRSQGFQIEEKGDITPTVTVVEEDIIIFLEYPIEAEKTGKESLEKFLVRTPLNIQRIYQIAKDLSEMQGTHHFLERDVLNLIVGFSGVSRDKLPPMDDTKIRIGNEITWQKTEVKQDLKEMLTSYIKLLQVYGTSNYEFRSFPGNSLLESLYNGGMLVPGSDDYADLEIRFNYLPLWNIYFDMNCDGETCKPESIVSDLVALIGVQHYSFIYDLSFPVLVEIYDPSALNSQGYRFKFFLEGNIRQNEPMTTDFRPIEGVFIESTMLCDENKRTSGEITINAKDYVTDEPLDNVQIAYSSLEENCLIGTTEDGTFKGKFPVMLGGTINFLKEDYITYSQRFDTELNKKDQVDIKLKPKLTKKFTVKKKLKEKKSYGWVFTGQEVELSEDEEAVITLTRKPSLQEGDYMTINNYIGNQTEPGEIDIAPGTYDMTISILYNKPIVIPPTTIEMGDESYPMEGYTLEAGYRVGGASINITFTKEALKKEEIVFYALNPDIVSVPESQRTIMDISEEIPKVDEDSKRYKGSLIPKFK